MAETVGRAVSAPVGGSSEGDSQQSMESEESKLKRAREADEDFITPNKTARGRSLSSDRVSISNKFDPIMDVSDLLTEPHSTPT